MTTSADPRLPRALDALRPRRAYVVCATPRSGSTLLCEMLLDSGIAGRPAEHIEELRPLGRPYEPREYFDGVDDASLLELLPASAPSRPNPSPVEERLADVLRHGTTPNGVFGTKLMWGYQADLQARLGELPGLAPLDDAARLEALLGHVRYVHVRREDHVAQAVSMWRAVQTRAWRAENDDACEPTYSFAGIDHLVRLLEAHDRAWVDWFARHERQPLEVRYSELAEDPAGVLCRVLAHIDVDDAQEGGLPVEPPLRRQAGEQSRRWADRYRRERESRA